MSLRIAKNEVMRTRHQQTGWAELNIDDFGEPRDPLHYHDASGDLHECRVRYPARMRW